MVDLPDEAVIIAGTDSWRYSVHVPIPLVTEPRLQAKIEKLLDRQGIALRKPPPAEEVKGFTPDIGAYRFPEWVIVQRQTITRRGFRSRRLVKIQELERGQFRDEDGKRYPVVPVRFVRACPRGHVGEIDWHAFVHGSDNECRRELTLEERGTSGDLVSVWVRCACGMEQPMSRAGQRGEPNALGNCNGSRPWLGPGTREGCGHPNRLLIRSASNAYFPQLLSVISIPDSFEEVDEIVQSLWTSHLSAVQTIEQLKFVLTMPAVRQKLEDSDADQIMAAIKRLREGAAADERPVKDAEFEALSLVAEELGVDVPGGDFFARALPMAEWEHPKTKPIERVVLVHRLREVVAQIGFTRFEAAGPDIQGELDIGVQSASLSIDSDWLPAIENRGEGIFIQLRPGSVQEWLARTSVQERDRELQAGFVLWHEEHESSGRKYPGLPFYMLHSLSHLLMTSIALECGYPASSLRERVYATPGQYGILIYTGSSDAEGTLGGLVQEGRRIKHHLSQALELGILCSNDPVCALHRPTSHDHQPQLGSACHGCLLISETSCEQHNDFLDRALVVPTVENRGTEFFRT
jgi:hypothetical protein